MAPCARELAVKDRRDRKQEKARFNPSPEQTGAAQRPNQP